MDVQTTGDGRDDRVGRSVQQVETKAELAEVREWTKAKHRGGAAAAGQDHERDDAGASNGDDAVTEHAIERAAAVEVTADREHDDARQQHDGAELGVLSPTFDIDRAHDNSEQAADRDRVDAAQRE